MCTRFSLVKSEEEVLDAFPGKSFHQLYSSYKAHLPIPKYNIPHEAFAHVITNREPDTIQFMRWGYIPNDSILPMVDFYNYLTRSEEMFEKKIYAEAARTRRCLILADGFVEWDKRSKLAVPFRFTITDQKIFAFAGIWDSWTSKKENVTLNTFSILTTSPNSTFVHHRMPVILPEALQEEYLFQQDPNKIKDLCTAYPDNLMDQYELTSNINDPNNDSPETIAQIIKQNEIKF